MPKTITRNKTSISLESRPPESQGKARQTVWRGFVVIANFFYQTPCSVAILTIIGLAMRLLYPSISLPMLLLSGSILVSRLVLKCLNSYNFTSLKVKEMTLKSNDFATRYPNIQLLAFVISVAISPFFPLASGIMAVIDGGFCGILIEVNIAERQLKRANPYKLENHSETMKKIIE